MSMRKFLAILSVMCIALGPLLILANVATAHANYVRSVPEAGASLPTSPRTVQVWFSEPVDPAASSLSVHDASGATVDEGDSRVAPDDTASLIITLKPLTPGTYTVIWQTLSAVDGHMAKGSFPFTVGEGHATRSYATLVGQMERNAIALQPPSLIDTLIRWSTLAALVLVAGGFAYAPFALAAPELASFRAALVSKRRRLLWVALGLLGITLIAGVALRAAETGPTSALSGRFGLVVLARVVFIALLALLLWRHWDEMPLIALPCAFLLFSQSLLSHSAAEAQWLLPTLADWLHLSAAAIWLGGVVMLALVVAPAALTDRTYLKDLGASIMRFSPLAIGSVIVIYLTGIAQSIHFVGSPEALLLTAYGRVLLAKIILGIVMIGFGAFYQRYVAPRIGAAEDKASRSAKRFRTSILAEAAVGLLLLAAAGTLTALPAGRDVVPDPATRVSIMTRSADDLELSLGVTPSGVGDNQFAVRLVDANGNPVPGIQKVVLRFNNLSMDMGESELTLQPYDSTYYTAESSVISMDGWWQTTLIVRRQGKADARATYIYLISF